MPNLVVVRNPSDWPLNIPGVETVSSRDYLTNPVYAQLKGAKIFNLSRSYRYQSAGYYVSLLAAARGHRPIPSTSTLLDMKSSTMLRIISDDLEQLIEKSLKDVPDKEFILSIYFGKNVAKKYTPLAQKLFNLFPAPLLRAFFVKRKTWDLTRVMPIGAKEIPENHWDFVVHEAQEYFQKKHRYVHAKNSYRYELAILHDPKEALPPSSIPTLKKFIRTAEQMGIETELITKEDYGRVAEFDALFIRTTTQVNHYTYRFSRRAEAEGLAVIDDPLSIIRCTNKVYLAEILGREKIPTPATHIITEELMPSMEHKLKFPCVLKLPDSAFSLGVVKAKDWPGFIQEAKRFFEKSDLIIVQEFLPTSHDWRIGVLDQKPLFACKYHMAGKHWQILKKTNTGKTFTGSVEAVALDQAPETVVKTALKAANLIGDGLYGVDIKYIEGKAYVIEINDNPNIDTGYEDACVKEGLYSAVIQSFLNRLEKKDSKKKPVSHEPVKNSLPSL